MAPHDLTEEQKTALDHARHLVDNGVPLFLAKPGPGGTGFKLPQSWQHTKPNPAVVNRWRPGMALCAVMGHVVDAVDVDPRNGGTPESLNGTMPTVYGKQTTPSGGWHYLVGTMGVRSRNGLLPGVDIKSGRADGNGRGFIFLAPTERASKETRELSAYSWETAPDITIPALIGEDGTGAALAAQVKESRRGGEYGGPPYDGPAYADLPTEHQPWADRHVSEWVEWWRVKLAEAVDWPEGETDEAGRGWEALSYQSAWSLAMLAAAPWTALDEDTAAALYDNVLPPEIADDEKCTGKWSSALFAKAANRPVEPPPWADFDPVPDEATDPADWPNRPHRLDDAHLAPWMAHKGLAGNWCWAGGLGWMHWDGRRWVPRREEDAREAVRQATIEANNAAMQAGETPQTMKAFNGLLSTGRIGALTSLIKGVVSKEAGGFDQKPDLLNCANGVVDLRTSELLPHDRSFRLTKITETEFRPGATHPDWDKALAALDPTVASWMQVRFGQAATGYPTSDDILPIGQGGGSNGKSTILSALFAALGEHMVQVPEKLLRAGANDHPTELMTLYGARVAVVDETPEVAQLNVQRLKATVGQEWMTARPVHKDNVTWRTTHSLFVMTNYTPSVRETDHGTWRRLALVRFTRTFPKDDRFRARMAQGTGGRREAVLAWIVAGARRWYADERVLPGAPARVVKDTQAWRKESDLVLGYLEERVCFDPNACVTTRDLLTDFNEWLSGHGQQTWSDKLLTARFGQHEEVLRHKVDKARPKKPVGLVRRWEYSTGEGRPHVWRGLRWRTEGDAD